MDLLEVNDFSLELKQGENWNPILSSLSFSLKRGETLGIVGESGSGKSVTALSLLQLFSKKKAKITNGTICLDTVNLLTLPSESLQKIRGNRIAMIFQEPMSSLNPVIKCGKQITEALLLHTKISKKKTKQKAIELLNDVQLINSEEVYNKYPHELSGGQKQRVMIAMAMCCHPDILIADEPTTALDVTVQKNILELLKQLQKKYGMSIIFISHDLAVVAQIAHRVAVMYQGQIVEQGDFQAVFNHPQHAYTKRLLECRNYLAKKNLAPVCPLHTTLFQIENLNKYFPIRKKSLFEKQTYFQALENITFNIYEGETLGLVGESGCGKTTLGRSLLRLIELDSGRILYKGTNISALSNKEMRHFRSEIQIVLQDPYSSLNQRLTVGQMLIEPMRVHRIFHNDKERKRRAIELLERVGMKEWHLHRYPHEFSGGQRQRIAIARALSVNPGFIVCDESVSSLDVQVQAQVLKLLNDLKQEFQLTYLFISHDLDIVKFMSNRIAVMQHGKLVEVNHTDDIYKNPKTEYMQQLIDAIPVIDFGKK